ncbi:MAG TPA: hypothetical protein PK801_12360 [Aggregatilineales bacterium]|nr:hypothetical protein [Aggregatilineales bacterium]HPV07752.1 hypothetical protein [Aggregatilineales bacterium]HQA69110.1 hypothetical protein [Aggregatilineales bacterium]HQE17588.1 hypothetical protein [Aggregatilineales bacterium]
MMSSPSATRPRRSETRLSPRTRDALIVLAAALAHALYLLLAWRATGAAAYPLDDSWIYQTYARNLARAGEWAFIPGVPSTGSTSILWTFVLAPGYLLPAGAYVWTQLAGFASLVAAALGAARVFDDDHLGLSLAVGLAVALEWHMVWAAASGMETAFFAALLVWFWHWLRRHDPRVTGHRWQDGLKLGVWGGVLMLARPEGVLALGVAGLYGLLCPGPLRDRLHWGAAAGAGFALLLVPFFGFNFATSGSIWPNTFYAKQTEYSVIYSQPYLLRLGRQIGVMFVGALALLLPGIIAEIWERVRARTDLVGLAPLAWVLLHWAMYAARLPVTYQHGRYAIPVVPVLTLYGIRGMLRLARPRSPSLPIRTLSRAWLLAAALLFPLTVAAFGAPAYASDSAFIQSEMVATARWVEENVPAGAALAVHDIGAIGYFSPRPLVDLAGLVSPDVVEIMHDAEGLAEYIVASGAKYLIVFPNWNETYREMIAIGGFEPVWSTSSLPDYAGETELGPMTVYRASP